MSEMKSLKQFEILSEDRRQAVTIFVQAIVLSLAIIGYLFKNLYDINLLEDKLFIGIMGIIFLSFCHIAVWQSRRYHIMLMKALNECARENEFQSPLSTIFIFNISWVLCLLLTVCWLFLFFLKIADKLK